MEGERTAGAAEVLEEALELLLLLPLALRLLDVIRLRSKRRRGCKLAAAPPRCTSNIRTLWLRIRWLEMPDWVFLILKEGAYSDTGTEDHSQKLAQFHRSLYT